MGSIEKTVFLSYRRASIAWALNIFYHLTHYGYDVFIDFKGIGSGDFERVILANINARAHFLVLLTPSALNGCSNSGDWLRREIESALSAQRNIVPVMLEGFSFEASENANQLTGALAALRRYSALRVYPEYFDAAMGELREKYLNVPLDAVLHPLSLSAQQATRKDQQAVAAAAPVKELNAEEWVKRGNDAAGLHNYAETVSWWDAIRRLFVRPKLSVCLVGGKGHKTVWNNEIPMYFYHLRVKNSRRTPAMNVEVLLMRLETAPSFGADFRPVDLRNRIQLAWPYPNLPNHQQRPNIGPEYVCDLGHLEKKLNEEPVFMLQTYIKPDDFESLRPREKMRLQIKAVAENAESEPLWLEIYWDGVWTDDPTSLAQHFQIKEIPSPMAA